MAGKRGRRTRYTTVQPALAELAALLVQMRPDWNLEQVTAELIAAETGSGWSVRLAVEAVRATEYDDDRLRLPGFRAYGRTGSEPVTPQQQAAYADYARRQLARRNADA